MFSRARFSFFFRPQGDVFSVKGFIIYLTIKSQPSSLPRVDCGQRQSQRDLTEGCEGGTNRVGRKQMDPCMKI